MQKDTNRKNAVAKIDKQHNNFFQSMAGFEDGQRIAKLLCSSDLVPDAYRNNIPNTLIALEIANRLDISPLSVLQNLYIVHGKPFWNSSFIIATINSCGRFTGLDYEMFGEDEGRGCIAFSFDKKTGKKVVGPEFTVAQARADGLFDKKGSKWNTRSELMLRYRAATLFGRLFAPDMLYGMTTTDDEPEIDPEVLEAEIIKENDENA